MIIATAGHIDHGKTALVHALTGIDTDRLPEEKQRGMSIDLGFAYQPLDSGRVMGFVDVPGHERFIRNMLAGVTGIQSAMLIVAADDGPMPQTKEHLSILDLLGVSDGVIALTKIDRVETNRLKEVENEIKTMVAGTCLKDADIMPVSAIDGSGIEDLRDHLEAMTDLLEKRKGNGYFRLSIDRCFTIQGAGLVVTGSVFSGKVNVGDVLTLSPDGTEVRVRGIHSQNRKSETGIAGERCAINIAGANLKGSAVKRGGWLLTPQIHAPVPRFDANLKVLPNEKKPLRHWTPVHVHAGAAEIPGRIAILGQKEISPGAEGLVQVVLDRRMSILRDDHFILRDQSAQRTIAGGKVVDPFSPSRGRAKPVRIKFLEDMMYSEPDYALSRLLQHNPEGVDLKKFSVAWNLAQEDVEALLEIVEHKMAGPEKKPSIFSKVHWEALESEVISNLNAWHQANPDRSNLNAHGLRTATSKRIAMTVFQDVLDCLANSERIVNLGPGYCLPGFEPALSKNDTALWNKIDPILREGNMKAPVVSELANQLKLDQKALEKFLVKIAKLGRVRQVAKNRFFLPDAVVSLAEIAAALGKSNGERGFSAAEFRDQTNIGRNLAIEILEFFDKSGLTWRSGDTRKVLKSVSDIFGTN
ncbi:MAG TPA: selenocysteine-specific translation elongation factor [Rhodospirillales bacterium]|nr:selenocysteine-specific translation elongation factor [Rhodospirillales bacterium]